MPIDLRDLPSNTNIKNYSPKYFCDKLTGNSKGTRGLLTSMHDPAMINEKIMPSIPSAEYVACRRQKGVRNNNTETTSVPFNPLSSSVWDSMRQYTLPSLSKLCKFGTDKKHDMTGYLQLCVHSLILEETTKPATAKTQSSISRKLVVCYQLFFFFKKGNSADRHDIVTHISSVNPSGYNRNIYGFLYTHTPVKVATKIAENLANLGWDIDTTALLNYFTDYSLYDNITDRAREWNEDMHTILGEYFWNVKRYQQGRINNTVMKLMRRLEIYNIPLDIYRNIYGMIKQYFTIENDATELCKQNLNLLLSDTLNNLDQNKSLLTQVPIPAKPVAVPSRYNKEQKAAVTTTEPLVLVQSGAGTGKSTVILGRIDWMIGCGISPEDITVLSFTNAAADHIKEKNPAIHSMTIASMIHSIYELNYPNHQLSNLDTIINSLLIYSTQIGDKQFVDEFHRLLWSVKKSDSDAFTRMNNFVEANFDKVINTLDIIRQTSLELEIIICYQQIDVLKEPADVASKYLIIDEVQDNSIFEFIYTIKYVDKHKESMYIVGDGSQTLYEFRASNPKALNVLEGSGVFKTYQLQINYRSVREILEFANVTVLRSIEANQYAKIWLKADSLKPMTPQSFTETITLDYHRLTRIGEFHNQLASIISHDTKSYIDQKLAKKEQVAFLAFRRETISICEEELQKMYPNKKIVSIVPERMYNTTVFSQFINKHWHQVKFIPSVSLVKTLHTAITKNLDDLIGGQQYLTTRGPIVLDFIKKYLDKTEPTIDMWTDQYKNGQITQDELLDNVRESMLTFEIDHNKIKQALLSSGTNNNKLEDAKDADIVLSTIHSAKGLEFDNTVVIYQADNYMSEEKKRMYYVALTRAMKSEYILAYGTLKSPQIEADYNTILNELCGGGKTIKIK